MKHESLKTIDSLFTDQYKALLETQCNIYKKLVNYPFDLNKSEITEAIYERMMAFWYFNVHNCADLNREVNTQASDFFTETCLLFIKSYFNQKGLETVSERNIMKDASGKTNIRPDISIWRDDELVAVIELKVSDGWKGKTMIDHLAEREKSIRAIHKNVFFGAIAFWNCFEDGYVAEKSQYIGLFKHNRENNHVFTGMKVEDILAKIEQCL